MSEDKFKFRCIHCGNKLKAPISFVGERIRCPHCSKALSIPDPTQASTDSQATRRPIRGMSDDSQKMKKVATASSALLKADSRHQEKFSQDDMDADTDQINAKTAVKETAEQAELNEPAPEAEPVKKGRIAPKKGKKMNMGATKSVKLSASQKAIIKPKKKAFKIKKKK